MRNISKILSLLLLTIMIPLTVLAKPAQTGKPTPPPSTGKVIILDAGHGGSDTGAVNTAYGLVEKDLNLEIAIKTKEILNANGYSEVYLTREDDSYMDNNARYTKANALGGNLLVSIHLNSFSDPSVNGTETLYGKKNKDYAFAGVMQQALTNQLGLNDRGLSQFASGVLLKSNMPSVITESVFMSNLEEAQKLASGTRQDEIAQGISSGIEAWINR